MDNIFTVLIMLGTKSE